jgi:hypothetical protein
MPVCSGEKRSGERPVKIGPPPYYHRSDCNICRKQDGLKTGSELLDAPVQEATSSKARTSSQSTPRCRSPVQER